MLKMSKNQFIKMMHFPCEWMIYSMYPDELFYNQINNYRAGDEEGCEHDRNGAFHWWLRKEPSEDELIKLIKLTYLDPDPLMASDVHNYIRLAKNFSDKVEVFLFQRLDDGDNL